MSAGSVVIELMPDRIDIAEVRGGRVIAARRLAVALPTETASWIPAVRDSVELLRRAVGELGLSGCGATILYRSPTQAVDVPSFELQSASEAKDAAILSCSGSLPYSSDMLVCEATVAHQDRTSKSKRWHIVVAADRDDVLQAMVDLVENAGLKFQSSAPIDAAVVNSLVERTCQRGTGVHGGLHVGRFSSFFVLVSSGAISFIRRINLGIETVVQTLTRPIHVSGSAAPVELSVDEARRLLFKHGIPDREQVVLESAGLLGSHVLPLMQPTLQRFLVELRQSLRFGLEEADRQSLQVILDGPAKYVPHIVDLLNAELQVQVSAREYSEPFEVDAPAAVGTELANVIGDRASLSHMNLMPLDLASTRQLRSMNRWMWAGAAAAVTLLAADGAMTHLSLREAQHQVLAAQAADRQLDELRAQRERFQHAALELVNLEQMAQAQTGHRVDIRAVLQELAELTPDRIHLTTIGFSRSGSDLTGSIEGFAEALDEDALIGGLEQYMDQLKQSPLLQSVVLLDVTASTVADKDVKRFSANFVPVSIPDGEQPPQMAGAAQEAAP